MPGYELFGKEEQTAINEWFEVNNGVMFAHGFDKMRKGVFKVREFEREVSRKLEVDFAQAVSSGSAALLVALRALGVKPGDEVITSAFTFVATVEAIIEAGAIPVIAEVDKSLNLDPKDVVNKLTNRTRGIIPVHMHGVAADMESISKIAREYSLFVLEDCAWVFGGTYHGKSLGTFGDIGIFSFDFAKNLTTGEGGMVVTNNKHLFDNSRAYHDHGHEYNPAFPRGLDTRKLPGFNFRMTEIQAVIGLTQLKKIDYIYSKQRAHKKLIKEGIKDCGFEFRHLNDSEGDTSDALIFFLESESSALKFASILSQKGLSTKNLPDALTWHFAGTWEHLFKDFPTLTNCKDRWPVTDKILKRSIALPIFVNMNEDDIEKVIKVVKQISKLI